MMVAHPIRRPPSQQMRPKYRSALSPARSPSPTNSTTRAAGRRGSKSSDRRRGNASHSPNTKNLSYTKQTHRRLPDFPSPRRRTGHRRWRNQRNRWQEQIALEAPLSTVARGKKEASRKVVRLSDYVWYNLFSTKFCRTVQFCKRTSKKY
jgi:hypothetical protein